MNIESEIINIIEENGIKIATNGVFTDITDAYSLCQIINELIHDKSDC